MCLHERRENALSLMQVHPPSPYAVLNQQRPRSGLATSGRLRASGCSICICCGMESETSQSAISWHIHTPYLAALMSTSCLARVTKWILYTALAVLLCSCMAAAEATAAQRGERKALTRGVRPAGSYSSGASSEV